MLKKFLITLTASVILSGPASAAQALGRTITRIAAAAGSPFYVVLSGVTLADGGACNYNVLFMPDISTTAGKGLFSILLTAYSQGTPISRIDYARDGAGNCALYLVQT